MSEPMSEPDQAAAELLLGLSWSWLAARGIHVAAELGIADLLREGPKTAEQLATTIGAHAGSLHRLLRMLAGYGIFAEDGSGRFGLTPVAALLQTGVLRDGVRAMSDADWNAYGNLLHNIKTGEPAFKQVHGMDFFQYLRAHPQAQERFDRGIANATSGESAAVAAAYDFGQFKQIADIGGGRGVLLAEILKTYPSTKGVLYDQPQVVAKPDYLSAAGMLDRCEVVGGDFFKSVPKGADAYVLKRIIHDWDDDICEALLRRCRDAAPSNGKVLVVDAVVPAGNDFHFSKVMDLLMMVLLDGRERTEADFQALFARAGLKLNRIVPTASMVSIVEGERA